HSHDFRIDLRLFVFLLTDSLYISPAPVNNKPFLPPSFYVLNHNSSKAVTLEAFRNGPAYSPSDPGLGRSVAQSIEVFEQGEAILRPISAGLRDLQDLMDRTERQKSLNKAFVAPVRRLPPELLTHVFSYVVADNHYMKLCNVGKCRNFSRVCYAWRSISLATPQLWTSISFWLRGSDKWQNRFESELQLTQDYPLDVKVHHSNVDRSRMGSWLLLTSQCRRWRTLTIHLNDITLQSIQPEPLVCSSLVSIYFEYTTLMLRRTEIDTGNTRTLFSTLAEASLMRTAEIRVAYGKGGYCMCLPPSWNLSTLLVQFWYCNNIGRLCPMIQQYSGTLEKLNFAVFNTEPGTSSLPLGWVVTMPRLTELVCGGHASRLIRLVEAPKLRHLTIDQPKERLCDEAVQGVPSTAHFITQFRNLRELHLLNTSWSTGSLIDTLNELTHLECLRMLESGEEYSSKLVTRELFERLTRGGVDADGKVLDRAHLCTLPKLSRMITTIHSSVAEDDAMIPAARRMALSRVEEGEGLLPLKVFSFRYRLSQDRNRWTTMSLESL
ncbi:hypothetical protein EV121DRAFT_213624, partial [Schizophyllum commune]